MKEKKWGFKKVDGGLEISNGGEGNKNGALCSDSPTSAVLWAGTYAEGRRTF